MYFRRLGASGVALMGVIAIAILGSALGFVILKKSVHVQGASVLDQAASIALKTWHTASGIRERKLLLSINTKTGAKIDYREAEKTSEAVSSSVSESAGKPMTDAEKKPAVVLNTCGFEKLISVNNSVRLNEIAWMGTKESASDEWMELKNMLPEEISLDGWKLFSENGKFDIEFGPSDKIKASGMFILERTDDKTLPFIEADKVYSGALPNSDFHLKLVDRLCGLVDEVDASPKWPAGDSAERKTMERNYPGMGWHTSDEVGGSPKRDNSELVEPQAVRFVLADQVQATDTESSESQASSSNSGEATSLPPISGPVIPGTGRIYISEVMAGKTDNSYYEFVEIWNSEDYAVDLTDWNIKKKSSTGSESALVSSSRFNGVKMGAGAHLLMANPKYDGSVSADIIWPSSYSLADKNNAVVIYGKDGAKVDEVQWTDISRDSSYLRQPDGSFSVGVPEPQNSSG